LKTHIRLAAAAQFIMFFVLTAFSQVQPVEVKRSQEKTVVSGRIFYIHTVQKGQTLYSISRAYEVTQEEIVRNNPGLDATTLKEGQALRIPAQTSQQAPAYPQNKEDFIAHRVKRGQTVYSLAKKYRVTEESIYTYNPWAQGGIKPEQTLWIPRKGMTQQPADDQQPPGFFFYTTRDKDTLYSIALGYGITVADIIENNPELRDGLKPGQVLKIPAVTATTAVTLPAEDTLDLVSGSCNPYPADEIHDVVLMLPFFARYSMEELIVPGDSIAEDGTEVTTQRPQGLRGRSFAEFYEGFLLAVDSLKSTGFNVNLHVFDTERDTSKVKRITRDLSLLQPDLIFGPVYTEDVAITGRYANYQEVNLVSPLSTRNSLVSGNQRIIQVIPSREAESEGLASYLSQFITARIILIRGTDSASMTDSWRFKKHLTHVGVNTGAGVPEFHDYKLNDSLLTSLNKVLSQQHENIIVVYSESEPDVSRLVSKLYMMSSLYPIKLFGMSSWQVWKTIELNYFHSLQLHLISPFFTDYTNPQVKNFLYKCRMTYGYEPYEVSARGYNFCMLGYDMGLYFLSALKMYGKDFQQCLGEVNGDLLLSKYHFVKQAEGGYVNNSYNLIRYNPDFTIEKISVLNGSSGN
jgi:LysM repeat protein/ABC-type branched-subunit amino acid transport system substrate-binding protein